VPDNATHMTTGTIHDAVISAVSAKNRLGAGWQGAVYTFDATDIAAHPILDKLLIKRFQTFASRRSDEQLDGDEAKFRSALKTSTSLVPVPHLLNNRNFGQAIFREKKDRFTIIVKQDGKPLDDLMYKSEGDPAIVQNAPAEGASRDARYQHYLRWLLDDTNVPEKALIDFYEKIRFINPDYAVDHVKKDNVFWDAERKQFNIIDLFTRVKDPVGGVIDEGTRRETLQRFPQILTAHLLGAEKRKDNPKVEIFQLLTENPLRARIAEEAPAFEKYEKSAESLRLEEQLARKIDRTVTRLIHTVPITQPNAPTSDKKDRIALSSRMDSFVSRLEAAMPTGATQGI